MQIVVDQSHLGQQIQAEEYRAQKDQEEYQQRVSQRTPEVRPELTVLATRMRDGVERSSGVESIVGARSTFLRATFLGATFLRATFLGATFLGAPDPRQ